LEKGYHLATSTKNHRKKRLGGEVQANKHHRTGVREEEDDPE
jgi:hypothetical protein